MSDVVIECPSCATRSHFDMVRSNANEFCPKCDYPLFFASSDAFENTLATENGHDIGSKRLPGTGGFAGYATVLCQTCSEPNPATHDAAAVCIRCGELLHPEPPAPPTESLFRGVVGWELPWNAFLPDEMPDFSDIARPLPPVNIWIPMGILIAIVVGIILLAWAQSS